MSEQEFAEMKDEKSSQKEVTELTIPPSSSNINIDTQTENVNLMKIRSLPDAFKLLESTGVSLPEQVNTDGNKNNIPTVLLAIELDRRRHKSKLLWRLFVFIAFFAVYLTILSLQKQLTTSYYLETALRNQLLSSPTLDTPWEEITTLDDFWTWLTDGFIGSIYNKTLYNGETEKSELDYTIFFQTKLIGGFRLVQERGKSNAGSYCHKTKIDDLVPICKSDRELTGPILCDDRESCSDNNTYAYVNGSTAFRYWCDYNDTKSYCGYVQEILIKDYPEEEDALEIVNKLKDNRWIDEYTRAVHIDSTWYNGNLYKWMWVRLTLHLYTSGDISTENVVQILRLDVYNWNYGLDIFRFFLEIVYILFAIGFLAGHCHHLWHHRHEFSIFFFDWHNASECLQIAACIFNIAAWSVFVNDSVRKYCISGKYDGDNFIDLSSVYSKELFYNQLAAICVMFQTLYGLQYFQVTNSGEAVIITIVHALPLALSYLPMYLSALCGFAVAGQYLFSLTITSIEWSTFMLSFFSLIELNLGLYDVQTLYLSSTVIGKIYLVIVLLVFIPLLFNIFLAIIVDAWDNYNQTRAELIKIQGFGVRDISVYDSYQAVRYRIPLSLIHRHVVNFYQGGEKKIISLQEFDQICDNILLKPEVKYIVEAWFWETDSKDKPRPSFKSCFKDMFQRKQTNPSQLELQVTRTTENR